MAKQPGRLHRRLSPNGTPLFEIATDAGAFNDDGIQEIVIHRGNDSAAAEISPSTLSFVVNGAQNIRRNTDVTVQLTTEAANRFAYAGITAADIRARFKGRRAQLDVDDVAWKINTVTKFYTTVHASSWTSLLRNTRRTTSPEAGANIGSTLVWAWNHPDLPGKQPLSYAPLNRFDTLHAKEWGLSFDDLSTKYGTDLGILFQHLRNGGVRILPLGYRHTLLNQRLVTEWPVLRSQTLSPAAWSTQSEGASHQYLVKRRLENGGEYSQVWPLPEGSTPLLLQDEEIDLLHIMPTAVDETFRYVANSRNYQANLSRYEIDAIRFDMIHLLSSSKEVDRRTAAQILKTEAGDPIYLSGDWPVAIRGPYFANKISESINSDSWEIEFSLFHPRDVLGLFDGEVPSVPAKVWDSMTSEWNDATGSWNSYA